MFFLLFGRKTRLLWFSWNRLQKQFGVPSASILRLATGARWLGCFVKNSLTGNNNFLSVGKLRLCHVLNPTGLVSGPSKFSWCFSAWEEVLPPAVLGQCPPCLFTYLVMLKPGLTLLSCLIIFVVFPPWKSRTQESFDYKRIHYI